MNKASQPQLQEYARAGAITAARVLKSNDGFLLVINVNWKEGDLTVYSQRNKPRVWQSLDRLIGHLERTAPSITHFEVFLTRNDPP